MKRKSVVAVIIGVTVFVVALLLYVTLKPCEHQWESANCEEPKRCTICGLTEGSSLGHQWSDASCEMAATCKECNEEQGEKMQRLIDRLEDLDDVLEVYHNWEE